MFADKLFVDYEMVEDPYVTDIALSGGCYTPLTPARQGDIYNLYYGYKSYAHAHFYRSFFSSKN